MLSPKEVALVDRWFQAGVPVRVVIRALQEGFERRAKRRQAPPGSLTYFESQIDVAIDDWHRKHTGAPAGSTTEDGSPGAQLAEAFEIVITAVRSDDARVFLEELRESLAPIPDDADVYALTTDLDGRIVSGLSELLSDEERLTMKQASRETGMRAAHMSARARARLEAAEFDRAVRAHHQIPSLSESLP